MRLSVLYFFLMPLLFLGCQPKKPEEPKDPCSSFTKLMGSQLPAWSNVRTKEDFANLAFFQEVYETNISLLEKRKKEAKIPKTVHFVWVGPKAFPRTSVENVRTWMAYHPEWTFKFWTDRDRVLPHPKMELCLIQGAKLPHVGELYTKSDNFGEMSDLIRLEILFKEGGVYADHDVVCLNKFDYLNSSYDLYCGMEVPYPTCLSTSVWPTNNLIGAVKGHPVLKASMDWLLENWDQIGQDYPGKDLDSIINRIAHRTFLVLGKMFQKHHNQEERIDIALPSYYFNAPSTAQALYAQHKYEGTWFNSESDFEKMTRERLMKLSKKSNQLLLFFAIQSILILFLVGSVLVLLFRRK